MAPYSARQEKISINPRYHRERKWAYHDESALLGIVFHYYIDGGVQDWAQASSHSEDIPGNESSKRIVSNIDSI